MPDELQRFHDKAQQVFGSKEAAAAWFHKPCMALDRQRPIDLWETEDGRQLLWDHLRRLEHGVYT